MSSMRLSHPATSRLVFGLLAVAVLVFIAACGDNDETTQQGSESAVCGHINALDSAINQVENLSSASSLDDFSAALSNLASSASDLRSTLRDVKDNNDNQVQAALSNLEQALVAAVNRGSLSGSSDQVRSAINQVEDALRNAKNEATCSS